MDGAKMMVLDYRDCPPQNAAYLPTGRLKRLFNQYLIKHF